MLAGRGAALVFEKPSARTRNSTELAVVGLGGHPVYIQGAEVGIDVRETAEDVARTLACYHAVICARVLDHEVARADGGRARRTGGRRPERAGGEPAFGPGPSLSGAGRPADDARRCSATLGGRTVAYIGDANNVWRSLALGRGDDRACGSRIASPEGYEPDADDLGPGRPPRGRGRGDRRTRWRRRPGPTCSTPTSGRRWAKKKRRSCGARRFAGFTIDEDLLGRAAPDAIVLHCLPAHRGEEITARGARRARGAVVWLQAANRMHAMRGLLAWLLGPGAGGERRR